MSSQNNQDNYVLNTEISEREAFNALLEEIFSQSPLYSNLSNHSVTLTAEDEINEISDFSRSASFEQYESVIQELNASSIEETIKQIDEEAVCSTQEENVLNQHNRSISLSQQQQQSLSSTHNETVGKNCNQHSSSDLRTVTAFHRSESMNCIQDENVLDQRNRPIFFSQQQQQQSNSDHNYSVHKIFNQHSSSDLRSVTAFRRSESMNCIQDENVLDQRNRPIFLSQQQQQQQSNSDHNYSVQIFNQHSNSYVQNVSTIPRSESIYCLEEEQMKHNESDEIFHDSYSRKRPWNVDDYTVVAAALLHLGNVYDQTFYEQFVTLFGKYIDDEELTYERVEEQIEFLRSNPEFHKEIEDESIMFLYITFREHKYTKKMRLD